MEDAQTPAFDAHGFEYRAPRVNGRERVAEDSARRVSKVSRVAQVVRLGSEGKGMARLIRRRVRGSFRIDEGAKLSEAPLAYAAHEHEVFGAPEGAEALALLDDARGQRGADAGKLLQLFARGAVDVDARGIFNTRESPRGVGPRAAWQFDASRGGRARRAAQYDTAQRFLQKVSSHGRETPFANAP